MASAANLLTLEGIAEHHDDEEHMSDVDHNDDVFSNDETESEAGKLKKATHCIAIHCIVIYVVMYLYNLKVSRCCYKNQDIHQRSLKKILTAFVKTTYMYLT